MAVQQYCLRWNNHQPNFISVFSTLLHNETLVDVTLAAEGRQLQAHKVVLSACSSYFQALFTTNPCQHPIVILKDVQYNDLKTMVDFMYYGEVNVSTEQLPQILKTAEMLKIKGLAEMPDSGTVTKSESKASDHMDPNQMSAGPESIWGNTADVQAQYQQQQVQAAQQQIQVQQQQQAQQQQQQQQVQQQRRTPSPPIIAGMSPAARRKRLRKSSTGSGSVERSIMDEHGGSIETDTKVLYFSHLNSTARISQAGVQNNIVTNVNSRSLKESTSTETEPPQHDSSQESIDDSSHQPSNVMKTEMDLTGVTQTVPLDISGSSSISSVSMAQPHQQHAGPPPDPTMMYTSTGSISSSSSQPGGPAMGSKRGRLLIRQPRIKKDIDSAVTQSADLDTPEATVYSTLLTVPRMERHASEPTPPTHSHTVTSPSLLAVPTSSLLIKQHSHPLLPSQSPPSSSSYTLQRQLSHPLSSTSYPMSSPPIAPLALQSSSVASSGSSGSTLSLKGEPHEVSAAVGAGAGALSPPASSTSQQITPSTTPTVVIVSDTGAQSNSPPPQSSSTSSSPHVHTSGGGSSNNNTLLSSTQRYKSEELHRSVSSPLTDTTSRELLNLETAPRSSHCPVVRPGPALGCNYCWNSIDNHGRILRRKTKYHCPDCQTNLCIVPCFQKYHENQESGKPPTADNKSSRHYTYTKSTSL